MKTKLFFLPILAFTATLSVSAQQIENDDVYFTAKDRATIKASREVALSTNKEIVARGIKSGDQYSGRTVNPEYTSRLNASSDAIQGSSNPYFDSDYTAPSKSNSKYYSSFNNYYVNSFSTPSYYGNPWNSPYSGFNDFSGMYGYSPYSSFYSSYYSPFPFSYTTSLSLGLAFGSPLYSPYYGYNSMMYGSTGLYGAYAGGVYGYYYPSTIIVNNGDSGSNTVYGKRNSRSSVVNNSVIPSPAVVSPTAVQDPETQVYAAPTSGRTSSMQQQYYQSNWRNNPDVNSAINNSRQSNGSFYNRSESLGTQNPSRNTGNSNPSWNSGTITRQSQTPIWNNNTSQSIPGSFDSPSRGSSSTPSWGGGGSSGVSGGSTSGGGSAPSRGR